MCRFRDRTPFGPSVVISSSASSEITSPSKRALRNVERSLVVEIIAPLAHALIANEVYGSFAWLTLSWRDTTLGGVARGAAVRVIKASAAGAICSAAVRRGRRAIVSTRSERRCSDPRSAR